MNSLLDDLPRDAEARHVAMLDRLIDIEYEKLAGNGNDGSTGRNDLKPGDLIKMIDLRHKLSPPGASHEKFWQELEKIRKRTLARNRAPKQPIPEKKESNVDSR